MISQKGVSKQIAIYWEIIYNEIKVDLVFLPMAWEVENCRDAFFTASRMRPRLRG